MGEWVNEGDAHSFALAEIYINDKFSGVVDEGMLLDLLSDAFDDDNRLMPEDLALGDVLGERTYMIDDWCREREKRKRAFCQLGGVVLEAIGTGDMAVSILEHLVDEELEESCKKRSRFLRRNGGVVPSKFGIFWGTGKRKEKGDIDRLMSVLDKVDVNVIVYDPLSFGNDKDS